MEYSRKTWAGVVCVVLLGLLGTATWADEFLFRVENAGVISMADMVADLKTARVVVVGEQHDNLDHHRAQLDVIRALHESGTKVAVGLEMFRADAQPQLDAWIAGEASLDKGLDTGSCGGRRTGLSHCLCSHIAR